MSAPYRFTPRLPAPPHSTPISASAYISPKPKIPRAPIQNPYEKLTQPEFEAFIGDITGALRRALGQVDPDEKTQHLPGERAEPITSDTLPKYGQIDLNDYEDEPANDSFAEIKARRVGKGKARDPREGPGLGKGDRVQPIEIVSSDEEEEEEVKLAIGDETNLSDEDDEEEVISEDAEEEDYGEDEDEDEYLWERGQSSTQPLPSPRKRSRPQYEEDEEEEEAEEYEEYYDEGEPEEEYEEEDPRPAQRHSKRAASPEVIDILSDGEEDVRDQQVREQSYEEGVKDEYAEFSEEDERETGQIDRDRPNHIRGSRDELFDEEHDEEQGEERKDGQGVLDDDDEIQETQPEEADTSFPPRSILSQQRPVEIHDPWSGPRTYAEDFYSGGDLRLPLGSQIDPNHLGPMDDEYMVESIEEQRQHIREEEEIQPFDEDTSFPPHVIIQHSPVDLPDPWEKPQEYAEDFYSQGDVRVLPGFPIDPSLLSGTADIDDSMENFLTPGILTPNLNEMRPDFEDEEEKNLEIRPPSPQRGVSSLQQEVSVRLEPEIITLNDESDEERDDREAAERWSRADAEVEEEFDELDYEEEGMEQDYNDDEDVHQSGINQEDEAEEDIVEIVPPPSAFTKRFERDTVNEAAPIYSMSEATPSQDEAVSDLVDWNNPPAFTQGIPATASGHLATPSSEEENVILDDAVEGVAADEVREVSSPAQDIPTAMEGEEGDLQETEHDASPPSGSTAQPSATQEVEEETSASIALGSLSFLKYTPPPAEVEGPEYFPAIVTQEPVKQLVTERECELEVDAHTTAVHKEREMFSSYVPAAVFPELQESILSTPLAAGVAEPADISSQPEGLQTDIRAAEAQPSAVELVMVMEDDIRPTPGVDDQTQPVVSTVASTSHPLASSPHEYEQLPTPPSERDFVPLPSQTAAKLADAPLLSSPEVHGSKDNEEVSSNADDIYQPIQVEMVVDVEFNLEQEGSPEYTVVESGFTDEEVDREEDTVSVDISVISVKDGWQKDGREEDYAVEEPVTEGRLTEEPSDRAMSLDVVSVGVGETLEESEIVQETKEPEPFTEEIDQRQASLPLSLHDERPTASRTGAVDESASPASEVAVVVETPATSFNIANPPMILQQVPMPVRANADVPDPTSRPHTPPRPDFIMSLPGSPGFVLTPLTTPRPTDGPVPVPVSVLKTLHEHSQQLSSPGPSHLQPPTATRLDGLFTPAEPSLNGTPIEAPKDDPTLALNRVSEAFSGQDVVPAPQEDTADRDSIASTPPYSREVVASPIHTPPPFGFDAVPERLAGSNTNLELAMDVLDGIHKTEEPTGAEETLPAPKETEEPKSVELEPEVLPPSSLPYRAPSTFADSQVKLTRKLTDPILMADPYPYSLSTPGASMEPQQYSGSDEDTGLDNSISSNSTLEKELVEGKDPARLLDDGEDLEFQYPPEIDTEIAVASAPPPEVEKTPTSTQVGEEPLGSSPTAEGGKHISIMPSFEEVMNAEDPFKLMGNASTVAPGAVEERLEAKENGVDGPELDMQTNGTPNQTTISPEEASEIKDAALVENMVTTPMIIPSAAQTPTAPSDSRPSKRKRDASPEAKALPASSKGKSRKASKSKGKAKEDQAPLPNQPIQEVIHVRRPSGNIRELGAQAAPEVASQTYRILQSGSRASSVASSGLSEHSAGTLPSPTVHKPHVSFEQAPSARNPLLHAHGQKRKLAGQSNTVKPPKRPTKKATRSKPLALVPALASPAPPPAPVPPPDPAMLPTLTPPPTHLFDRSMLRSLPPGPSVTSFIIQPFSPFKPSLAAVPPPPPPPPPAQPPSLLHAHGKKRKQTAGNLRKSTIENADHKKPSAAKSKSSVETRATVEPTPAPALVPAPVTIEDVFTVPTAVPQPLLPEAEEIHAEPEPIDKPAQSPAVEVESAPKAESPTPLLPCELKPSESTSHDAASPTIKDEPASTTLPIQVSEHGDVSAASSSASTTIPSSTRAVPARQVSLSNPKTGSRSTRSQCRYHRISLPKEEGGPRACFLVPGCSLNDREFMKEEQIEDHGDATDEDSLRMVKDVETLDFDQYLIGVLRHLVGLDIIREQEIYYLPQPGEAEVARKYPLKKLSIERPSMVRGPGDSSSYAGSPGYSAYSASIRSPSVRAPPSVADSTSTSRSALRMLMGSEVGSSYVATDSEDDDSDYDEPERKRVKPSPSDDEGETVAMGPPTKSKGKGKLKARKSKTKDVTYNPEKEDHEGESMDEGPSRLRRKKSTATKRSLKRTRTTNDAMNGEEGSERHPKKLKMHATAPGLLSPSKDQPQPQTLPSA